MAAALVVSAVGCGKTEEKKEAEKETYQTVGNKTEDSYEIKMTNKTGKEITSMAVKRSDEEAYPSSMLGSDKKVAADETILFYYTPEPQKEVVVEGDSELAGAQINLSYSLSLGFGDGTSAELSTFAVEDMKDAEICMEDEVYFFTYTSISEETEISTKEREYGVKQSKDAAAAVSAQIEAVGGVSLESEAAIQAARAAYDALTEEQKAYVSNADLLVAEEAELNRLKEVAAAEEAARAEAEAQAAAEAAAQQTWTDNSSYDNSSSYSGGGSDAGYSGGGASGGASQSTEGCLGNVLINN